MREDAFIVLPGGVEQETAVFQGRGSFCVVGQESRGNHFAKSAPRVSTLRTALFVRAGRPEFQCTFVCLERRFNSELNS